MSRNLKNSPKVLGLDISTKTIGWALFDIQTQELLELTHISPRPKIPKDDDKLLELLLKSEVFAEKLKQALKEAELKKEKQQLEKANEKKTRE